jgi:hypothetical protein
VSAREPQPLLHHMSAPPRTVITFRPLRALGPEGGPEADPASGLRWLSRLTPAELIRVRPRKGAPGDDVRLRLSLARAQVELPPPRRLPIAIARLPLEAVADALRALAADVPLASLGLPAFGLLLLARGERRPHEGSVRLTVAVLARRRGSVFLRDAAPLAPASLEGPALDLWALTPPAAAGEGTWHRC